MMLDLDMAALIVASRHCRAGTELDSVGVDGVAPPVTAAIDDVIVERPVRVGQVMNVTASLTRVWGSSMEVEVVVEGEDITKPEWGRWPVLKSHATFVALDAATGKPCEVAPLTPPESEMDERRFEEAEQRKTARALRRNRNLPWSPNGSFFLEPPIFGKEMPEQNTSQMDARTPAESFVQITETIFATHTNSRGTAFGGQILAWGGMATAISAGRHCTRRLEVRVAARHGRFTSSGLMD